MQKKTFTNVVLLIVLTVSLSGAAFGGTFDIVSQFNTSVNPNASSTFSYGYGVAGSGNFSADSIELTNCLGSLSGCFTNSTNFPDSDWKFWNATGAVQHGCCANVLQTTDNITFDPQSSIGDILRFTAPTDGLYSLAGNFSAQDLYHHTTTAYIYENNLTQLFTSSIGAYGAVASFNVNNISLTAGQTLDFIVYGNGDSSYLTTGLQGTITSEDNAPEPGTIGLLLLGLSAIRIRRK